MGTVEGSPGEEQAGKKSGREIYCVTCELAARCLPLEYSVYELIGRCRYCKTLVMLRGWELPMLDRRSEKFTLQMPECLEEEDMSLTACDYCQIHYPGQVINLGWEYRGKGREWVNRVQGLR